MFTHDFKQTVDCDWIVNCDFFFSLISEYSSNTAGACSNRNVWMKRFLQRWIWPHSFTPFANRVFFFLIFFQKSNADEDPAPPELFFVLCAYNNQNKAVDLPKIESLSVYSIYPICVVSRNDQRVNVNIIRLFEPIIYYLYLRNGRLRCLYIFLKKV